MTALKPCPFCGAKDEQLDVMTSGGSSDSGSTDKSHSVVCLRCGAIGPSGDNAGQAAEAWGVAEVGPVRQFTAPGFKDWSMGLAAAERGKLAGKYGSIQNAYGEHCARLGAAAQREAMAQQFFSGLEVARVCPAPEEM